MTEQFLQLMRQWLDQLEPSADSTDSGPDWQQLYRQLAAAGDAQAPVQVDLLYRITRQNEHFHRFACELLTLYAQQDGAPEGLDRDALVGRFRQHLDRLNADWVLHSWPLPAQLNALLLLCNRDDSPLLTGLKPLTDLLRQLLSLFETRLQPSLIQTLRNLLTQLQRFEQAQADYLLQLSRINTEALARFNRQLEALRETSVDELHRLWIDSYEHCYQQALQQDAYARAYAELSNAVMALRQAWQQPLEQLYGRLGLVTQSQYDALSRQHHELRRRVRQLERQLTRSSPVAGSKDRHDPHQA